jgi:hypothetical protein
MIKDGIIIIPKTSKVKEGTFKGNHIVDKIVTYCFCIGLILLVPLDWGAEFWHWSNLNRQIMRGLLLGIMFLYVLITGVYFGSKDFKTGKVLAVMAIMLGIYAALDRDLANSMYYYSRILFWILGSVVIYRLTLAGAITHKTVFITIGCIILISSLLTIYHVINPVGIEKTQNTRTYIILWCIPLLLIGKRSKLKTTFVGIASIAIVLAIKRGSILALLLSICAYIVSYVKINFNFQNFLKTGVFALVLGMIVTGTACWQWNNILLRNKDLSNVEKIGSGRGDMYYLIVRHWLDADITHKVFGFGSRSVQRMMSLYGYYKYKISYSTESVHRLATKYENKSFADPNYGGYAHSDWLQFLHDNGLIGIVVLGSLHFTIIYLILIGFQKNHPYTPSLVMGYIILFLVNIYSGHLVSPTGIYFGMLIGFISAKFKLDYNRIFE